MLLSDIASLFLESCKHRFQGIKDLGDKSFTQLDDPDFVWKYNSEVNSIAVIIQHLHGNMLSRWTDFLTSDGEKSNRNRDGEFIEPDAITKSSLITMWNDGWDCVFKALDTLTENDLSRVITIRGQSLNVIDAIHRQISHYGYHVGQIVHIARECRGTEWKTLSIARGASGQYIPSKRD